MLIAKPRSLFSWDFDIVTAEDDSQVVATLEEVDFVSAAVRVGETVCEFERTSRFGGPFQLKHKGQILAEADKPSMLKNQFAVQAGPLSLKMKRTGLGSRNYVILERGVEAGQIYRRWPMMRTAHLEMPSEWPQVLQVFLFWLVIVAWMNDAV